MPHDRQKKALFTAVSCLRSAQELLMQVSRDSTDPLMLAKINNEYTQLDSFLSQILHCLALADDKVFADNTAALKEQAGTLKAEEDHFKAIGAGVNTAAQIAGLVAEALGCVAKV